MIESVGDWENRQHDCLGYSYRRHRDWFPFRSQKILDHAEKDRTRLGELLTNILGTWKARKARVFAAGVVVGLAEPAVRRLIPRIIVESLRDYNKWIHGITVSSEFRKMAEFAGLPDWFLKMAVAAFEFRVYTQEHGDFGNTIESIGTETRGVLGLCPNWSLLSSCILHGVGERTSFTVEIPQFRTFVIGFREGSRIAKIALFARGLSGVEPFELLEKRGWRGVTQQGMPGEQGRANSQIN